MTHEIVPTRPIHIAPMARTMRPVSANGLAEQGINLRRVLHHAVVSAHYSRTALIDGQPIAMWGMNGPILSDRAQVWLVLSDAAAALPMHVARAARRELSHMLTSYPEIVTTLMPGDHAAARLAGFLGFSPTGASHGDVIEVSLRESA